MECPYPSSLSRSIFIASLLRNCDTRAEQNYDLKQASGQPERDLPRDWDEKQPDVLVADRQDDDGDQFE